MDQGKFSTWWVQRYFLIFKLWASIKCNYLCIVCSSIVCLVTIKVLQLGKNFIQLSVILNYRVKCFVWISWTSSAITVNWELNKMAWPRCHVVSKRIINCQKVQFLILIQARPFSCYTSARARKQVFRIKRGCSNDMYYHSFEMNLLPHRHHQDWWHYLVSKSYLLLTHLCHQQWARSPLLFCESDKTICVKHSQL